MDCLYLYRNIKRNTNVSSSIYRILWYNCCIRTRYFSSVCGTIALVINSSAYIAEIIRAGINAVDKGQMEAARSLGLNYRQTMKSVIMPQAIKTFYQL